VLVILGFSYGILELACWRLWARLVPEGEARVFELLLERRSGAGYFTVYRPHPYMSFDLDPDYEDANGRWHSPDGFRLPLMPKARRPGVFRIACLGGSTTYDNYIALPYTYVAYLEEYLNRAFPGHPIEILNAGVGGANSADNFARFHFKVLDYAPDMVVNYDGINDVWPMLCEGPFENDLRNARKPMESYTPPGLLATALCRGTWWFRLLYFELVLRGRVPSIMDLTYKPYVVTAEKWRERRGCTSAFRRDLEDEAFICKGRGIELILCTFAADDFQTGRDVEKNPYALLMEGVQDLNEVVKDVAAKQGLPLLDFDRLMPRNDMSQPKERFGETHYFGDICHNTPRGNRVKANISGAFIASLLEKRWGVARKPFEHDTTPRPSQPPARLDR